MQATQVSFITSDRFKLYGLWYAAGASKGLAIYIHGAGDSNILRKGELLVALAETLEPKNYDVMAFNNRGAGYVSRVKKYDEQGNEIDKVMSGMAYERIADCTKDIDAAIDWALENGYESIALIGHSTGANKAVIYANSGSSRLKYVAKLFLLSGGDDITLQNSRLSDPDKYLSGVKAVVESGGANRIVPEDNFPGEHPITYGSLLELIEEHSDYDIFPFGRYDQANQKHFELYKKINIPTIVIYGSEDFGTVIEVDDALTLLSALNKQTTSISIKGADHGFTNKDKELAVAIANELK